MISWAYWYATPIMVAPRGNIISVLDLWLRSVVQKALWWLSIGIIGMVWKMMNTNRTFFSRWRSWSDINSWMKGCHKRLLWLCEPCCYAVCLKRSPGDWQRDTEHRTLNTAREGGWTVEVGTRLPTQHRVIKQGRITKGQTYCLQSNHNHFSLLHYFHNDRIVFKISSNNFFLSRIALPQELHK